MIPVGHKKNFDTLHRASKNGDLAIIECTDKKTMKPVYVVAAVYFDGEEYTMTPIAKMFDVNPYDEVNPPVSS